MNKINELKEKIRNNKKEMMGTGRLYDFETGLAFGRLLRNAELLKAVSELKYKNPQAGTMEMVVNVTLEKVLEILKKDSEGKR